MAEPFQPRFVDLVRNTTTTQGTGNLVLGAAVTGFTSFAAAVQPGESFYYCVAGVDKPAEREVGRGTMQANGTISRVPIDGTLTNLTSGTKTVSLVAAAEWFSQIQQGSGSGEGSALSITRSNFIQLIDGAGSPNSVITQDGNSSVLIIDPAEPAWWAHSAQALEGDFTIEMEMLEENDHWNPFWFASAPVDDTSYPTGNPFMFSFGQPEYDAGRGPNIFFHHKIQGENTSVYNIYSKLFIRRRGARLEFLIGETLETAFMAHDEPFNADPVYLNSNSTWAWPGTWGPVSFRFRLYDAQAENALTTQQEALLRGLGRQLTNRPYSVYPEFKARLYLNSMWRADGDTTRIRIQNTPVVGAPDYSPYQMQFFWGARQWNIGTFHATRKRFQTTNVGDVLGHEVVSAEWAHMLTASALGVQSSAQGLQLGPITPTTPQDGSVWFDGTKLKKHEGGVTTDLDTTGGVGTTGDVAAYPSGAVGDGTTPDQAAINTALTSGNVILEAGKTYAVSGPILIPSNRTLYLNGATILMVAPFTDASGINAVIGSNGGVNLHIVGPGTIDANKIGSPPLKKNGVMFLNVNGALVDGNITIRNCSGYGAFTQGSGSSRSRNITWRKVHTFNCEVHFEQMQSEDITHTDCSSGTGDGDISCASFLHPVFNSLNTRRIRFINHTAVGLASAGVEITGNSLVSNEDIYLENCHIEVTAGIAIVVNGALGTKRVKASRSKFISGGGEATYLFGLTEGAFDACLFKATTIAVVTGASSRIDISQSRLEVNSGGVAAGGVASWGGAGSRIRLLDCEIDLTGASISYFGGVDVFVNSGTRLYNAGAEYGAGGQVVINNPNDTKWLEPYDAGREIILNWNAQNQTVFLYADADRKYPNGTWFDIVNPFASSGGTVTVSGSAGVTINSAGSVKTIAPHGRARITKLDTNIWLLVGDLGSGGIGGGVPDPIVPADGTQNITGGLTTTGHIQAGSGAVDDVRLQVMNSSGYAGRMVFNANTAQLYFMNVKDGVGYSQFTIRGAPVILEDGTTERLRTSGTGVSVTGTFAATGTVTGSEFRVAGTKVVGAQGAAVADATDAASAITQLNALLARLRTHGLIAT